MNIERINTNGFDGSDDLIGEIEVVIGKKLPDDYKLLLIKNNGGHPELDSFFLSHNISYGINNFYSINNSKYETILSAINRWGKVLGKGVLPIARDGGDNQFYLNLNETEPSVWIYLHDGNDKREKLADSLAEFIDKLQINSDYL